MARKCRTRRESFADYILSAKVFETYAESPKYFYSQDGMKRLKKSGTNTDEARRKVLASSDMEERELWMRKWGLI